MKAHQQIRTKIKNAKSGFNIRGWLSKGGGSYLWFGLDGSCIGTLSGTKLYRLCEAILKRRKESDG